MREEPIKQLEQGDFILSIYRDMDLRESPREGDNLGKMVLNHKKYVLPNELKLFCEFKGRAEIEKYLKEEKNALIIIPIRMYDHSGISISTSTGSYPYNDYWDSSFIGWIVALKDDILKEYGNTNKDTLKKVREILMQEVKTYDQFLTGDVYGFTIEKKEKCDKCGHVALTIHDSCWGFYGDDGIKQIEEEYFKPYIEKVAK